MTRGKHNEPVKEFFTIGDVCALADLKPHVLRYWETQFKLLMPAKNRSGIRVYQRKEIELVQLVKHLLYNEGYTIEGARKKLDEHRKAGRQVVRSASRAALDGSTLKELESELTSVVHILDGKAT